MKFDAILKVDDKTIALIVKDENSDGHLPVFKWTPKFLEGLRNGQAQMLSEHLSVEFPDGMIVRGK